MTEQEKDFFDPDLFVFSFESHGLCETPQRFFVKEGLKERAYVLFWKNDIRGFVWFGVSYAGGFRLGNESSKSFCWELSCGFDGIEDTTLSGQNGFYPNGPFHHCARLVAVHLSD